MDEHFASHFVPPRPDSGFKGSCQWVLSPELRGSIWIGSDQVRLTRRRGFVVRLVIRGGRNTGARPCGPPVRRHRRGLPVGVRGAQTEQICVETM